MRYATMMSTHNHHNHNGMAFSKLRFDCRQKTKEQTSCTQICGAQLVRLNALNQIFISSNKIIGHMSVRGLLKNDFVDFMRGKTFLTSMPPIFTLSCKWILAFSLAFSITSRSMR